MVVAVQNVFTNYSTNSLSNDSGAWCRMRCSSWELPGLDAKCCWLLTHGALNPFILPCLPLNHRSVNALLVTTLLAVSQILVELAELQDAEVGDGTTSVVIVAAELLRRANDLVRAKIHPTSIISGYRLAMREVSVKDEEIRITGSKAVLARAAAQGLDRVSPGVLSFVREWRARLDSNQRPLA